MEIFLKEEESFAEMAGNRKCGCSLNEYFYRTVLHFQLRLNGFCRREHDHISKFEFLKRRIRPQTFFIVISNVSVARIGWWVEEFMF